MISLSQRDSVKRCTLYALSILDWTLDLSPVSKDGLRYMSDFGFVLLAFAALFIIQVHQTIKPVLADMDGGLEKVMALSDLMIDLAVSSTHCPAQLGRSLQRRVVQARQETEKRAVQGPGRDDTNGNYDSLSSLDHPISMGQDTGLDQFEEGSGEAGFSNDAIYLDPSLWLTDFLNDVGEFTFP